MCSLVPPQFHLIEHREQLLTCSLREEVGDHLREEGEEEEEGGERGLGGIYIVGCKIRVVLYIRTCRLKTNND